VTVVADTIRNGVDTGKMFATLDLIKAQPELARFQFRAANRWIDGAHNRSAIKGFYAAGDEDTSRGEEFQLDAGEPAILLGSDTGPNPAEYLLHALAACLTTSIVYVAAARRVELTSVESTVTGDMDVRRRTRGGRRAPQRVRAHRRGVPHYGQRAGGEAPRGRGAGPEALGRLRHGDGRRARRRRGRDRLRLA
jgi:organic hydroperoxide reductase OsmC/OhrA